MCIISGQCLLGEPALEGQFCCGVCCLHAVVMQLSPQPHNNKNGLFLFWNSYNVLFVDEEIEIAAISPNTMCII